MLKDFQGFQSFGNLIFFVKEIVAGALHLTARLKRLLFHSSIPTKKIAEIQILFCKILIFNVFEIKSVSDQQFLVWKMLLIGEREMSFLNPNLRIVLAVWSKK